MSRRSYPADPRWIVARFGGTCRKCGATVRPGERAYYYPSSRAIYTGPCAEAAARDFESMAHDEEMMSR